MHFWLFTPPDFCRRAASINHRERYKTDRINRIRSRFGIPVREALSISPEDLEHLLSESRGECQWCGKLMRGTPEYDHILPLSRGGENVIDNLAVCCRTCNRRKAGKDPVRWAHEIYARTGEITPLITQVLKVDNRLILCWQLSLDDALTNNRNRGLKNAA